MTLPLYRGTSQGEPVWYVITDASERDAAERLGVNWAPKLANSTEGRGAQRGSGWPESIAFTATVDFAPERCISQGDYGQCAAAPFLPFGPTCFAPGATGKPGYSPLVELEDGTVLNASHIANSSGRADKATVNGDGTVTLHLTEGRALGRIVHYVSLDAGSALGAVVENVTVAPELAKLPRDVEGENASHLSARAGIIAFINGQNGLYDPDRQGLSSTILDRPARAGCGPDFETQPVPLNILQAVPNGLDDPGFPLYSPMWDTHFVKWQLPYEERLPRADFDEVRADPDVTNQIDGPFGPAGAGGVGNCPVISIETSERR